MELLNEVISAKQHGAYGSKEWEEIVDIYLKMLAPIAPHISEEIWFRLNKPYSIHQQTWPIVDESALEVDEIMIVVQINGKLRDKILISSDIKHNNKDIINNIENY